MAEADATKGSDDANAQKRVREERDEARAALEDISAKFKLAEAALAGYQLRDTVYKHFASKEPGDRPKDPYGVAGLAANDASLREIDTAELPSQLDDWYVKVRSLAGAEPAPAEEPTEAPPVPKAAGPSPAGGGSPVTPEPQSIIDWQKANPGASLTDYKSARQSGEVAPATR